MRRGDIFLVVGLGNPGRRYAANRHNVGYRVADEFCRRSRIRMWRKRFNSKYGVGTVAGERCAVIKPGTYMNRSGYAVAAAAEGLGVDLARLVVVSDDITLPTGRIRVRRSGSSGGHKGLASIVHELGTEGFPRLRVGVGDPGDLDAADFVLEPFTPDEEEIIAGAVATAARALEIFISAGIEQTMAEFNR